MILLKIITRILISEASQQLFRVLRKLKNRYRRGRGFESRSKPEFFLGLCFSSVTAALAFDISIYPIATGGHLLLTLCLEAAMKYHDSVFSLALHQFG